MVFNFKEVKMPDPKDNEFSKLIPAHGGYRDLQTYQMSEIAYAANTIICVIQSIPSPKVEPFKRWLDREVNARYCHQGGTYIGVEKDGGNP